MSSEFNIHLLEGHYDARQGQAHTSLTVLPGENYDIDLRPDHVIDFKVISEDVGHDEVILRVSAEGSGRHTFTMRSDNLVLHEKEKQEIDLTSGVHEAVWHAHVVSAKTTLGCSSDPRWRVQ